VASSPSTPLIQSGSSVTPILAANNLMMAGTAPILRMEIRCQNHPIITVWFRL
jgi:hypothetical protein